MRHKTFEGQRPFIRLYGRSVEKPEGWYMECQREGWVLLPHWDVRLTVPQGTKLEMPQPYGEVVEFEEGTQFIVSRVPSRRCCRLKVKIWPGEINFTQIQS